MCEIPYLNAPYGVRGYLEDELTRLGPCTRASERAVYLSLPVLESPVGGRGQGKVG